MEIPSGVPRLFAQNAFSTASLPPTRKRHPVSLDSGSRPGMTPVLGSNLFHALLSNGQSGSGLSCDAFGRWRSLLWFLPNINIFEMAVFDRKFLFAFPVDDRVRDHTVVLEDELDSQAAH